MTATRSRAIGFAIVAVILTTVTPAFAKAVSQPVTHADVDRIAKALEAANAKASETVEQKKRADDGLKTQKQTVFLAFAMLIVAALETAVTGAGVVLVVFTLREARRAANAAEESVKEAAKASTAAIRGLDQPWLYIQSPILNATKPTSDKELLFAGFEVVNHGKAPALIKVVKAALFYSPGEYLEDAFPAKPLPATMTAFPSKGELARFGIDNYRDALERVPGKSGFSPISFGNGIVLPAGNRSVQFLIRGNSTIDLYADKIPIEHAGNIYLLGYVVYETVQGEMEFLNFCYEAGNSIMPLLVYKGAPYNERRKYIPEGEAVTH